MWSTMKILAIGLFFGYLHVQRVVGQSGCKFLMDDGTELPVDGFDVHQLENIQDIEKPRDLLVVRAEGVESITKISSESKSKELYIQPVLENGKLTLKLTEHFADYEEYETAITIAMSIVFKCTSGEKKLGITQPIVDTNNHSPEFLKTPYIYTLPMPFPKNVSLHYFGSISARDIDLTNRNISFHLDPDDPIASDFTVLWLQNDPDDRKVFSATLITKTVINLAEDATFTLYATDTGTPEPNTSPIDVTIKVDPGSAFLQFSRSLYTANLTNLKPGDANEKNIPFDEGPISLQGNDDTVTYTIQDHFTDYQDNFKIIKSDDNTVQLRLIDPPEKFFLESFVLLSLNAHKPGTKQSTTLHISLPGPKTSNTDSQDSDSDTDNIGYIVAVIVLVIILAAVTAGLVFTVIKNRRITNSSGRKVTSNDSEKNVPEMKEIRNGSVSPSGSFRKSVAFNDTVEEINIARL